MNVASPAGLHNPGSTPQIGISPAEIHTPSQGEPMQPSDPRHQEIQAAFAFVRAEIDKMKSTAATAGGLQPKNLTPEEKDEMKLIAGRKQIWDFIGYMDKLAPYIYFFTKDEQKTSDFLRLVYAS
jgi:hypothetical protein